MSEVRVRLPPRIVRNEPFEVRTLVTHDMESGQRRDERGQAIPRRILNRFACTFNGREVVSMDLAPAIAANPYLSFWMVAGENGTLRLRWTDDDGSVIAHEQGVTLA